MIFRTTLISLLAAVSLAAGRPATRPAATPATQHFPTPQELLDQMKKSKAEKKKLKQVAFIDLSHPVQEAPAGFSFFRDTEGDTLHSVLDRLHQARDDRDVRAILITIGDAGINLAQAQEIRDALLDCRHAGKTTVVYSDSYDTAGYVVASGASDICLLEGGEILIPGVGIETMFAKGLLDKVGVQADYIQIGEYKGADEMYTRNNSSPELKGQLDHLSQSIYDYTLSSIARQRKLDPAVVKSAIDQALIPAPDALKLGLVDHLIDIDGLRDFLKQKLHGDIDLIHDYGAPEEEQIDFSNPWTLLAQLTKKPEVSTKPSIAIVYAEGEIVDGAGGNSWGGSSTVGSDDLREAFRMAARDDTVKAVVIRIDSPGGSALASEAMWQAARRVAAKKPVVISVGSMAASGGYYLASSGDYIIADPTAIVGSIGVVGGKFVIKDLYAKLGITAESFSKGDNANLFSNSEPFTDKQRALVTGWMKKTYDQFTQRILTTRGKKIADIDKLARGRIFTASQARDLGMVDELGGLSRALAYAAEKSHLANTDYDVRTLPPTRTLSDYLTGNSNRDAKAPFTAASNMLGLAPDSILRTLPTSARNSLLQQIQSLHLLEKRPFMLVCPYTITIR
ncbi:MAG TPA: signal peptide peptidase SppA [Tepidisphaeraceae bacterium]|nr:signal peptide peptidase SppA [Tepidisphaeraceae bacterium]